MSLQLLSHRALSNASIWLLKKPRFLDWQHRADASGHYLEITYTNFLVKIYADLEAYTWQLFRTRRGSSLKLEATGEADVIDVAAIASLYEIFLLENSNA